MKPEKPQVTKRRKTLQRWRDMDVLGAEVYDAVQNKWFRVKTQKQGLKFFRTIASEHERHKPIPRDCADHEWLCWLLEGHYGYREMCPAGIDYFVVHRNSDIGYRGNALGFGVVSIGANGFVRPFSFRQALLGLPKDTEERVRIAFRHAIEDDVTEWGRRNFRSDMVCPVFGVPLEAGRFHIDHDPPFKDILGSFCRESGKRYADFESEVVDVFSGVKQELDLKEPLRSQWRHFHWYNACFQFVSVEGHLELDKRRRLVEAAGKLGLANICP